MMPLPLLQRLHHFHRYNSHYINFYYCDTIIQETKKKTRAKEARDREQLPSDQDTISKVILKF